MFLQITGLILLFSCCILSSCSWIMEQEFKEKPLCRVYEQYLYPSDLKGLVGNGHSKEDSLHIIKSYIDHWLKQHLMLKVAKENMEIDKSSLKRKIADYTNTLIIYDYEQALLQQKMDTTVSENEINKYYSEFSHNFSTKSNWIKLAFVQIDPKAPKIDSIAYWLNTPGNDHLGILEGYCNQYAEQFTIDTTKWYDFEIIIKNVPLKVYDPTNYLRYNQYISVKDSQFQYFLKIYDYRLKGQAKPLNLVSDNIKKIIINKRKRDFLEKLHNNVFKNTDQDDYEIMD